MYNSYTFTFTLCIHSYTLSPKKDLSIIAETIMVTVEGGKGTECLFKHSSNKNDDKADRL